MVAGPLPHPDRYHRFICVLDEDRARWLAVTLDADGEASTLTEGDPEFECGWGGTGPRRLVDSGRYQQLADGSYRITGTSDMGAGVYRVEIGPRAFTCLRVIDLVPINDESAELGVAFVEPGGRTVLYREYSASAMYDDWQVWRAAHPGREIVIADNLFLQRDCTGFAHDVLTTATMDTSTAHVPEARQTHPESATPSSDACSSGTQTHGDRAIYRTHLPHSG